MMSNKLYVEILIFSDAFFFNTNYHVIDHEFFMNDRITKKKKKKGFARKSHPDTDFYYHEFENFYKKMKNGIARIYTSFFL